MGSFSSLLTVVNFAEAATAAMNVSKDANSSAAPTNAKPVDVQTLMKSDPRFIARLIQQLDSQMHNMQDDKKRRQQAVKEDTEEMQRIDQEIKMHIQPGLVSTLPSSTFWLISGCMCVLGEFGLLHEQSIVLYRVWQALHA